MTDHPVPQPPEATSGASPESSPQPPQSGLQSHAVHVPIATGSVKLPTFERHRLRSFAWVPGVVLVTAAVMSAVAASAITYAATKPAAERRNSEAALPPAPVVTQAEAESAKAVVCQAADISTRNMGGHGGITDGRGTLNLDAMVRGLNSVVAVEHAITTATPPDVAGAAHSYIDSTLNLQAAAAANILSGTQLNDLNHQANGAIDHLLDVCGLPH